jgi:hypothetical protein
MVIQRSDAEIDVIRADGPDTPGTPPESGRFPAENG